MTATDSAVHRYYDPMTGDFLTVDPDVAETQQPYYYAGDDPVNETDPSGDLGCGFLWLFSCSGTGNAAWIAKVENSPAGEIPVSKSEVATYIKNNKTFDSGDLMSYVDSFDWSRPVEMIVANPKQAYIKYSDDPNKAGNTAFGTNQIYTSSSTAAADLYLTPYDNHATYAWYVQFTKVSPVLWGFVADSANGLGTQFLVGPWKSSTVANVVKDTPDAMQYSYPPFTLHPIASYPGLTATDSSYQTDSSDTCTNV